MNRPRSGVRPSIAKELERITDSFGEDSDSSDPDKTPVHTLDARGGVMLRRDACRETEDRETGETCFVCCSETGSPGDGLIRSESADGRYTVAQCPGCLGTGFLTHIQASELRNQRVRKSGKGA
jgi:hypothetical protein